MEPLYGPKMVFHLIVAMLPIFCDYTIKWTKEKRLPEILSGDYFEDASNIENIISLIQKSIAYDLPILLRSIYDVKSQDTKLLTYMEAGAFKPMTRKMIEIGIPRETAIYLANYDFTDPKYDSDDLYQKIRLAVRDIYDTLPYWVGIQVSFLL